MSRNSDSPGAPDGPSEVSDKARVRCTTHLVIRVDRKSVIDLDHLMKGQISLVEKQQLEAFSPASGAGVPISLAEVELLTRAPESTWTPISSLARRDSERATIERLVGLGLLVSHSRAPGPTAARTRDESVAGLRWDPFAAAYHYASKWKGVVGAGSTGNAYDSLGIKQPGKCPPVFYEAPNSQEIIELPGGLRDGPFYEVLQNRKTTRDYEPDETLSLELLSCILRYTFGSHGLHRGQHIDVVRKTSPSGGGLHPVEVYPVVRNVEGLSPGIYHYHVGRHALETLRTLEQKDCRSLVTRFTAGQVWCADANAIFVMAVRFARSYWKYPFHNKAYKVLLMDAAHLSQTLYLVSTELGLGCFFTAAINDCDIEEELNLDPGQTGVVGIAGCGHASAHQPQQLVTEPYTPNVSDS